MISSVQRQCNGINLTRQHIFFTFSRLTLRYQFHYDSWLIPLEILKRIPVNNRLSIWLIITESERKLNFLSVSTGGLIKLVTLPLCRFHKCHQSVLYVTQHCQERISAKTFLSDARQPEVRPSPFLYALTLTNLYC